MSFQWTGIVFVAAPSARPSIHPHRLLIKWAQQLSIVSCRLCGLGCYCCRTRTSLHFHPSLECRRLIDRLASLWIITWFFNSDLLVYTLSIDSNWLLPMGWPQSFRFVWRVSWPGCCHYYFSSLILSPPVILVYDKRTDGVEMQIHFPISSSSTSTAQGLPVKGNCKYEFSANWSTSRRVFVCVYVHILMKHSTLRLFIPTQSNWPACSPAARREWSQTEECVAEHCNLLPICQPNHPLRSHPHRSLYAIFWKM